MNKNKKILVTGSSGLLGSQITNLLIKKKYNVEGLSSKKIDLVDFKKLNLYFKKSKPKIIIHTANKVFGIGGNYQNKFEMINENLIINSNLLKACKIHKIKKFIFISSSAVYSEKFKHNIKEKNIFTDVPHKSELYYGISKRVMLNQLEALYKDFKIDYCYIVMNNLYGINDNFDINNGHVVPSLIHKFYLGKKRNKNVYVWGKSSTKRCFLFSKDAARMIVEIMNENIKVINLSSKNEVTIGELSSKISKILDFKKKVIWKNTPFKAAKRRSLDLSILRKMGIKEKYSLEDGLKETIEWFKKNYNKNIKK